MKVDFEIMEVFFRRDGLYSTYALRWNGVKSSRDAVLRFYVDWME